MEISLNIYNPFGFRLKGNNIILENNTIRHFNINDKEIIHSKNSLGLRGPELTNNDLVKIITVGGSTTENFYHDDKKTWPYLFYQKMNKKVNAKIWVNNAGLDGHSTYGHIKLIEDFLYKIEPDIIIFFIGANDINLDKENTFDINYDFSIKNIFKTENQRYFIKNLGSFLATKSEFFSLLLNLYRYYFKTQHNHIYSKGKINMQAYDHLKHDREIYPLNKFNIEQNNIKNKLIPQYRKRIEKLISLSKIYNFKPVFITQPTIYGSSSKKNLEKRSINSADRFYLNLELYNQELRLLYKTKKINLIDIAKDMPKSKNLFVDKIHFTSNGLEFISRYLYDYFSENCDVFFDFDYCK